MLELYNRLKTWLLVYLVICVGYIFTYHAIQNLSVHQDQKTRGPSRPGGFKTKFCLHESTLSRKLTCENLLQNLTRGQWIKKIHLLTENRGQHLRLIEEEREIEIHLQDYRERRKITKTLWRKDHKCGFGKWVFNSTQYYITCSKKILLMHNSWKECSRCLCTSNSI